MWLGEITLNRTDAAETKHCEASRPYTHLCKKSVIARSLFATRSRMRASGLRLEGSIVNGLSVPCGSQSKSVIVYSGAWTDCG